MGLNHNNWGILGHDWAVKLLQNHLAHGRLRHAYLFTGPRGVGRRTLALRLAQAINCTQPQAPGLICGECRACELIHRMEHPDLTIVQAEGETGILKVDQVRSAQHSLSLTPYEAQFRIAIFRNFESANLNAANALLKTLEEPPPQVILMVTAQDPESLLPTIVSRCELIRLHTPPVDVVASGLETQFGLSSEKAKLLAHISGGRPGYARKIQSEPEILTRRESWLEDHQRLISAKRVERFDYADAQAKDRTNLDHMLEVWGSFWRDVLLVISDSSAALTNDDWRDEINSLAGIVGPAQVIKMIKTLENTSTLLNKFINARLALEVLLLDLPYVEKTQNSV